MQTDTQNEAGLTSGLSEELDASTALTLSFFDEGCLAFENSKRIDECPYLRNSEASNAWRFGWGLEMSLKEMS